MARTCEGGDIPGSEFRRRAVLRMGGPDHTDSRRHDSWHRLEALSPSRVLCTQLSRITKDPFMSPGMPKEPQSTFSLVAKIERSAFGTPAWEQKSRRTRPTVMKFYQSLCKCIGTNYERVCATPPRSLVSAHTITPSLSLLVETDRSSSGM